MVDSSVSQKYQDLAHVSRIQVVEMTEAAGSGHPTTCASAAELLSVLFFHEAGMHYLPNDPQNFASDRLVLSKGHAAPILYSMWHLNGHLSREQIMSLRRIDSDIEGHPTPRLDFVDVATGSLGQGLGVGCGMAYSSKFLDKIDNRYFVLLGDGECAEGSVWEAFNFGGHYKLDNLCAIIDVNGLGQTGQTALFHDVKCYQERIHAFGWETAVIDGHNVDEVIAAFEKFRKNSGKPFCIIAKTEKGKYFTDSVEGKLNWHGKALGKDMSVKAIEHIKTLIKDPNVKLQPTKPKFEAKTPELSQLKLPDTLDYDHKKEVATRNAFGSALKRMAGEDKNNSLVSIDGDTQNSTFACTLEQAYPQKFVQGFIAEQNCASVAQGLSCRKKIPFVSAFAAFFSRAFDQVRMGGISTTNTKYVGTHVGISIGDDGGSQMGLEDIAMFRTIPDSVVLYPADAVATERAIALAANHRGTVYVRCGRPNNEIIYANDEKFEIGKAKVLVKSDSDKLTLVSGGVTLHECRKAAALLKNEGINVRVVDLFSVKPVDRDTLLESAKASDNKLFIVEDHYASGGLFEAVAGALAQDGVKIYHTCVEKLPRSGKPSELYEMFGLSAGKIAEKAKKLI